MTLSLDYIKVTLAALLHDIGKFYQRTGDKLNNSYYESFMKNNGYGHAAFTAKFINEYLDDHFKDLLIPSAEHHVSANGIVKISDIYSSGHDRKSEESYLEEVNQHYITGRMYSIFYILFDYSSNSKTYVNLSKQQDYFPSFRMDGSSLSESKNIYKKLFDEFVLALRSVIAESHIQLHHYLYPLIKEYTTTIPSSTFHVPTPTVSLFDHLKLTAAIANVLSKDNVYKTKQFLIVEYNLSGIRKFVYKITQGENIKTNIAKSLRARSFYVSFLCDFVAYLIVHEFGVTYENILYTSGGRGQILVPNYKNAKKILQDIISKLSLELFKIHNDELSFSFSSIAMNAKELQYASFKEIVYGENREQLLKRNQMFSSFTQSDSNVLVDKPTNNVCKLCESFEVTFNNMCSLCNKLILLNDQVLNSSEEFVIEFDFHNIQKDNSICFSFGSLGQILIHNSFSNNYLESSYYQSINKTFIGETRYYAQNNNGVITNLLKVSTLAVVMMDIDNLGQIFLKGFKDDKTTISKVLTLSRNIEFFFTKVIVDICKQDKFKNSIYIIYSGGDDFVVVLPVLMSLEFINEVNHVFNFYTGHNEKIHLSAGLWTFSLKESFHQAISNAKEQLVNAKKTKGKNSIGLFNEVIPNSLLDNILKEIGYFKETLSQGLIKKSFFENIFLEIKDYLDDSTSRKTLETLILNINNEVKLNIQEDPLFLKIYNIFNEKKINNEQLKIYKIVLEFLLLE